MDDDRRRRMLRSPTVWEDVVKTLVHDQLLVGTDAGDGRALVTSLGRAPAGFARAAARAFPTPRPWPSRTSASTAMWCAPGYRAPSFVRLAAIHGDRRLDLEALGKATREERPDAEVEATLLALPGIGPYAAAHVMMTLGRNSKLILDSWTRPTYARLSGARRQPTDAQIQRASAATVRRRDSRSGCTSRSDWVA